ncbi:SPOR domain-containing protein [Pseudoduganella albidiflava]|uniref:Cell division protein n=1 Tax=Pseudoduganella albidiflava TaxID=321983 RepID=A0A411X408_9BURK|nr:SPOR domain-containing protein [Pseudoduganella albidiflava]QBI03664.1 SPOR domain-containing protein [Pseudoduganella albidiflava]GGY51822.1 cell division protein [Pseudoduganella albidiflava]
MSFRSSPRLRLRQQGSTLVGIIIGLVIGLVIAVIVALMITKGQSPFTERTARASKPAESSGQIADPNKPMYGNREAARSANRDFEREQKPPAQEAQQPAPAADPLQAVVDRIQNGAEPKAANPAAPVPPNTAAPPTQSAAPAPSPAGEDKWVYYLQAGAYRETADAEAVRAKLALLGFEASVTDRTTDSGVLHRVRVGPFSQVEAMNKVRSKLSENGVDVAVVRNQR